MDAREALFTGRFVAVPLTLTVLAAVLAMAGCRNRGRVYDEINRRDERFALEDRIVEMSDRIESLQQQLASCRGALTARNRNVRDDSDGGADDLTPPTVEGLNEQLPKPPVVDEGTQFDPGEASLPLPALPAHGKAASGADANPAKLVINRLLTGGYDADEREGHEGLLVVFEPRDEMGRLVEVDGAVDIAVVNPSLGFGPEADVARWHFDASQAASYRKTTLLGGGYQFELPWPTGRITAGELRVYVRLITPDRQTLTASHDIQVIPPGSAPATNWSTARKKPPHWTSGQRRHPAATAGRPDWTQAKNQPPIRIAERPAPRRLVADDSDHEVRPAAKRAPRPRWSPYR